MVSPVKEGVKCKPCLADAHGKAKISKASLDSKLKTRPLEISLLSKHRKYAHSTLHDIDKCLGLEARQIRT